MDPNTNENLTYLSFFFVDVVGLSDPTLAVITQITKLNNFNNCISQCNTFKSTPQDNMLFLPTGDGMVIGFNDSLEKPLNLALELHEKLHDYNKDKPTTEKIFVRIGLHCGSIFLVKDVFGDMACWGPGIILARRVMDIGDENHILMTSEMAERLFLISGEFRKSIHPLHSYEIKHDQTILVYSIHGENFGNPNRPIRGLKMEAKFENMTQIIKNQASYNNIELSILLKDPKTNLLRYKKSYYFENVSDEPIFDMMFEISTSVEKNFSELHVQAYDENDEQLNISEINLDIPHKKEFSLKLNSPSYKGGEEKKITIIYEAEEPAQNYENFCLVNSEKFSLSFNFPTFCKINPRLYLTNDQKEKFELEHDPHITKGIRSKIRWAKPDGIYEGDLICLEW